jgi:transketolase
MLFYDDNSITIEGRTHLAYSDDVSRRFKGYNWNVLQVDAHNFDEIDKAIRKARRESDAAYHHHLQIHHREGQPEQGRYSGIPWRTLGPR